MVLDLGHMINCSCLILSCWCLIWIVEDILAWRLGWRLESSGETPPPPAVHPNTIVNSDMYPVQRCL